MTQANAAQLKAELDAGEGILRTATLARLAYAESAARRAWSRRRRSGVTRFD